MNISLGIRAGILFPSLGPYHIARVSALAGKVQANGGELTVIRFSESSDTYGWLTDDDESLKVVSLLSKPPRRVFDAFIVAYRFFRLLRALRLQAVLLPSYSPLPNLLCLLAAKFSGAKAILMCESWSATESDSSIKRLFKRAVVPLFSSALVGGTPHKDFIAGYGIDDGRIFLGYDVVDNGYFESEARKWSSPDAPSHPFPHLPARYFLNLGRFVPKKNLQLLVKAYDRIKTSGDIEPVSLVLVGEGESERELRELCRALQLSTRNGNEPRPVSATGKEVVFFPFQQIEFTPLFFAACEAFILPSEREEWGLVVNEALASGAPVIVSDKVGSAFDLVRHYENGYVFESGNVDQLAAALSDFANNRALRHEFSKSAFASIAPWSTTKFAESGFKAIRTALYSP